MRSVGPTAPSRHAASTDGPSAVLEPRSLHAVVLDADSVLTDSQSLRVTAWRDTLDAYLAQYARVTGRRQRPLDVPFDLPAELLGCLEEDTAVGLLRDRGARIDLASAHLGPSEEELLELLIRHQDERYLELLNSPGAPARSGAERLLLDLRGARMATAAVSTGRHCAELLDRAGIVHLVDVCVDAGDALSRRLAGPPAPALYEFALQLLHVPPAGAALVADTPVALEAGSRAGFGRIIAVGHRDRALPQTWANAVGGLDRIRVGPVAG